MPGRKKNSSDEHDKRYVDPHLMVGDKLNFAGSEAYKLLRTNLEFTLPDDRDCRVIGVTSGLSGEGKSTTALNLSYSIAETGKKVLLIEADMRRPMLSTRVDIKGAPGLSNVLAGKGDLTSTIQESGLLPDLYMISGGDIPPNPSELLGSLRMKALVNVMSKNFQTIIIDLPPVNVVTDALVAVKYIDGMIMVVRKDYSSRKSVGDAMRLLKLADIKILGFVVTRAEDHGRYYYRKSSKEYKNNYKKGYGYSGYYGKE